MLKRQVGRTPAPQWVRVVGGFTEHQFAEKRLPTIEELNVVAPDTPVFILHLYDRALLNAAALQGHAWTGAYVQLRTDWRMTEHVTTAVEAVHFAVGQTIRAAGGKDADYLGVEVKYAW